MHNPIRASALSGHDLLSSLPPALAGDLAFRRFCAPKLSESRSADHDRLTQRARFYLRNAVWQRVETVEGEVQTYTFVPKGPVRGSILVIHGWTSEASFMAVIGEQLRRAGFRTVLVDCPAHGKSERELASFIDCTRAVLEVAERLGPFDHAVAHSMGCLGLLLAGADSRTFGRRYMFDRYVLIGSPNRFTQISSAFSHSVGLSAAAQRFYERHIARISHRPLDEMVASQLLRAIDRPALLLHCRDDHEITFDNAVQIAAACPKARVEAVSGFGHRNILSAPPVIKTAIAYLTRGSSTADAQAPYPRGLAIHARDGYMKGRNGLDRPSQGTPSHEHARQRQA